MVSISVPGMSGWGNPSAQLPGVLGSSAYHRSGLGTPFFMAKPPRYDISSSTRTTHPRRLGVPMTRGSAGRAQWAGLGAARPSGAQPRERG
jgi:hypothetical protein